MPTASPDYERLERLFQALAYSSRLQLLHQLRLPRALSELRVAARMARPGEQAGRIISRQAAREHLDRLLDADLVIPHPGPGPQRYQVNGQRLYETMEEFRRVGTIVAGAPIETDETMVRDESSPAPRIQGPHLVIVHGLVEGRSFPLDPALADAEGWLIGRAKSAAITLDYDPYVSQRNALLEPTDSGFRLVDLGSRNGTTVNWSQVAPDRPVELRPGDVIGVGGTLLVYRD